MHVRERTAKKNRSVYTIYVQYCMHCVVSIYVVSACEQCVRHMCVGGCSMSGPMVQTLPLSGLCPAGPGHSTWNMLAP